MWSYRAVRGQAKGYQLSVTPHPPHVSTPQHEKQDLLITCGQMRESGGLSSGNRPCTKAVIAACGNAGGEAIPCDIKALQDFSSECNLSDKTPSS